MRIRLQTISARSVFATLALTICLIASSLTALSVQNIQQIHTVQHHRLASMPESSLLVAHSDHRGSGRLGYETAYRGSGRLSSPVAHRGSGRLTDDLAYRGSGRLTQQTA